MDVRIGNVVSNVSVHDGAQELSEESFQRVVNFVMAKLREQGMGGHGGGGRAGDDGEIPDRMSEVGPR